MKIENSISYLRNFTLSLFILFTPYILNAQNEEVKGYKSTAEEAYYLNFNTGIVFQNKTEAEIINCIPAYIKVDSSKADNPFNSIVALSKYEEKFDKELTKVENDFEHGIISNAAYSAGLDSLMNLYRTATLGKVLQRSIITTDTNGQTSAIVFKSDGPEATQENLWLALSNDKGVNWKNYYLGIAQNRFFNIKAKQKKRLLPSPLSLQLEAALINITKTPRQVTDTPSYVLLRDNILLSFPIKEIIKDSDNDGLTDIYENKIATNPLSKDSDMDSIADNTDTNPRFGNLSNDFATLGKYLINKIQFLIKSGAEAGEIASIPFENKAFYFFIIEDARLRTYNLATDASIIFTKEEFASYALTHTIPAELLFISPLFPIDNQPNFYKINIDSSNGRISFFVKWEENGWYIKLMEEI